MDEGDGTCNTVIAHTHTYHSKLAGRLLTVCRSPVQTDGWMPKNISVEAHFEDARRVHMYFSSANKTSNE